ncbi:methylesterase 1-like [Oryza brachyantha]|uniref:methylesterase 1-like n=1 Tax=Oryza brachyantha TaxID=4533 RepID=UPI001ADAC8B5|nr:methylesterase 1-like [Oryza brachyantha]
MEHQPVAGQQRSSGTAAAVGRRCCCYRVAAPDLAASGVDGRRLRDVPTFRDYTEPLLGVLRSLPAGERAVLVGHSLGGLNVALAAELLPEKVAAAVFLSAFMPDCSSPPSHVLQQVRVTYTEHVIRKGI